MRSCIILAFGLISWNFRSIKITAGGEWYNNMVARDESPLISRSLSNSTSSLGLCSIQRCGWTAHSQWNSVAVTSQSCNVANGWGRTRMFQKKHQKQRCGVRVSRWTRVPLSIIKGQREFSRLGCSEEGLWYCNKNTVHSPSTSVSENTIRC